MAIPTEYSGKLLAIRLSMANVGAAFYRSQRTRVHIHGDTGDVTSGEDFSKRRLGTVPDWEVTYTKASFDNGTAQGVSMNPFNAPLNFELFTYIQRQQIYPGGIDEAIAHTFDEGLIDDFETDQDANMLSPFSLHVVCANGEDPTEDPSWYPVG